MMSKKKILRKNRRVAVKAAALAMGSGNYDTETSATLWALTVFFESYLWRGAEGTKKDFGGPMEKKATVLQLVR
jgi:hypothetical protein